MTTEEIIAWENFPNILEKARSKANRHYPSILEIDDDAEFGEYDINEAKREIFIEGYLEAEKDLALTWEDILKIGFIADEMDAEGIVNDMTQREYCEEVSKRFNEQRKK